MNVEKSGKAETIGKRERRVKSLATSETLSKYFSFKTPFSHAKPCPPKSKETEGTCYCIDISRTNSCRRLASAGALVEDEPETPRPRLSPRTHMFPSTTDLLFLLK